MSYQNFAEAYIQPQYMSLTPECKDISNNFPQELQLYLAQYPEFTKSQSHLQFLQYCFDNYINMDPYQGTYPFRINLNKQVKWPKISWVLKLVQKDSSVTAYPLLRI
jgi:hypothetical protein